MESGSSVLDQYQLNLSSAPTILSSNTVIMHYLASIVTVMSSCFSRWRIYSIYAGKENKTFTFTLKQKHIMAKY